MRLDSVRTGSLKRSLPLSRSPAAPADARRFIRRLVTTGDQRDVLELLVSELVTNAVRYADGDIELTVCEQGGRLRVEVNDGSSVRPRIRESSLDGGCGLRLVEALAECWGVDDRLDGKAVWFEIRAGRNADPSSGFGI